MLIGITNTADGTPIIRVPKMVKVSIGVPRGPALYVWIQRSEDGTRNEWLYKMGTKAEGGRMEWNVSKERVPVLKEDGTSNRALAETKYWLYVKKAATANYPQKLPYFTFTRPEMVEGVEQFVPDFEAIERFGPTPTSIDVVFMDDVPFDGEYAMWSTSELKCHGDGVHALRKLAMAATDEEKALAAEAKARNDQFFPVITGCATTGCSYYRPTVDSKGKEIPALCKASFDLKFQLIHDIRVGSTSYFHTSGFRSISQLFSGLMQIQALTGGRLRGVPVRLNLRPYKTKHNGQAATQYGVYVEFRAGNVEALKKNLLEAASQFSGIAPAPKQIQAPAAPNASGLVDVSEDRPYSASVVAAEFYPEAGVSEDDDEFGDGVNDDSAPVHPAATASAETQATLKETLKETPETLKETPKAAEQTQATVDSLKEQLRAKEPEITAQPATEAPKKRSLF